MPRQGRDEKRGTSDVQKPYTKKMQYLAKVWDGSKGRVGDNLGYWGCMAVTDSAS